MDFHSKYEIKKLTTDYVNFADIVEKYNMEKETVMPFVIKMCRSIDEFLTTKTLTLKPSQKDTLNQLADKIIRLVEPGFVSEYNDDTAKIMTNYYVLRRELSLEIKRFYGRGTNEWKTFDKYIPKFNNLFINSNNWKIFMTKYIWFFQHLPKIDCVLATEPNSEESEIALKYLVENVCKMFPKL